MNDVADDEGISAGGILALLTLATVLGFALMIYIHRTFGI